MYLCTHVTHTYTHTYTHQGTMYDAEVIDGVPAPLQL